MVGVGEASGAPGLCTSERPTSRLTSTTAPSSSRSSRDLRPATSMPGGV
jgi:hypothetical protein